MDSNSTPRFQMLPGALLGTSGKRFVVLRNGEGMTLDIGNRAVCNFTEILESGLPRGERTARVKGDRFFRLESGTTALSTTLVATGGGATVSLIIGVKILRVQTVQFNSVTDTVRGGKNHTSTRPPAEIKSLLKAVNNIWFPQANVEFVGVGGVRKVKLIDNMGDPILLPPGSLGTPGLILQALSVRGVDLNVFFVWNLQDEGNSADVEAKTNLARAGTGITGVCMFEDQVGGPGQAMAHEFGHHLGLDHPGHGEKDLMFPFTGPRVNLSRADVELANP